MLPNPQGSFRLFQVFGITVYLHWSWLLVAAFEVSYRGQNFSSPAWNVAEYLALFGIVLLHEFGHSLACRQVGGRADQIVLWPLGGVAYVQPPPRPGAVLWSIAAGPLVNVALAPVLFMALRFCPTEAMQQGGDQLLDAAPDITKFVLTLNFVNALLLVFNLLPIYPLDGGQILQALLWFIVGRARSLLIASTLGLIVGACLVIPLLLTQRFWLALMALFVASRSWYGFQQARMRIKLEKLPRHRELACPSCGEPPLAGAFWECDVCQTQFDVFANGHRCPSCAGLYRAEVGCLECGYQAPPQAWTKVGPVIGARIVSEGEAFPH